MYPFFFFFFLANFRLPQSSSNKFNKELTSLWLFIDRFYFIYFDLACPAGYRFGADNQTCVGTVLECFACIRMLLIVFFIVFVFVDLPLSIMLTKTRVSSKESIEFPRSFPCLTVRSFVCSFVHPFIHSDWNR